MPKMKEKNQNKVFLLKYSTSIHELFATWEVPLATHPFKVLEASNKNDVLCYANGPSDHQTFKKVVLLTFILIYKWCVNKMKNFVETRMHL